MASDERRSAAFFTNFQNRVRLQQLSVLLQSFSQEVVEAGNHGSGVVV